MQMKTICILLLLSSCSMLKKQTAKTEDANTVPKWIYAPYEECQEEAELCATGEAKTYAESDAEAKKNLASIFEVQVKSEFSTTSSSTTTFPWQSQVREEVTKSIQESVNQILEGVQVKKHFKHQGLTYALASLDRTKASDLLGNRLSKIDHELEALWATRQRTNLRKVVKLNLEREKLNERYSIVAGHGRPAKVKYEDILRWRNTRPKVETIAFRVSQAPEWMTEKLQELLSESGFRLTKGDAPKVLSLNVDSIKEYLNVEGFEKYTFTMTLATIENGEKQKTISYSESVTGRSQADALLRVKHLFSDYIEQHLSDLELD